MPESNNIYTLVPPSAQRRPVIISSPHSGTFIPKSIADKMTATAQKSPDTDHFIDQLYTFGPSLGFYLIHATCSRYVVDLNRSPDSSPLYSDGRKETSLVPTKAFSGEALYEKAEPTAAEIIDRQAEYYDPYHAKLNNLISELKEEFGEVLLFDAHSIRRTVPSIQQDSFPDMILGNLKGTTANSSLIETAMKGLSSGFFEVADNTPFMGGHITRSFGSPGDNIHALQLEMSQDVYMNEDEGCRDPQKEAVISAILRDTLDQLGDKVLELK